MNDKLINRIENNNLKGLFYNTACLKVTAGNDFYSVYKEMLTFVKQTTKEKGCIEFFAAPSNLETGEIMLWEVWENEADMHNHMNEEHTKNILSKNLVEFQWGNTVDMSGK